MAHTPAEKSPSVADKLTRKETTGRWSSGVTIPAGIFFKKKNLQLDSGRNPVSVNRRCPMRQSVRFTLKLHCCCCCLVSIPVVRTCNWIWLVKSDGHFVSSPCDGMRSKRFSLIQSNFMTKVGGSRVHFQFHRFNRCSLLNKVYGFVRGFYK